MSIALPPIPVSVPDLRGDEWRYLKECVDTNWISSAGPFVPRFESEVASFSGAAHGVAIVNGTCALELALRASGVENGDTVLVPDWTFVATANAVWHCNAVPHFVDVTESTWTMDPGLLEVAIASATSRVGAIVPVHSLGHPAAMDAIRAIASSHGIPVVEDAAGAIGSKYKSRVVGSGSTAATLSFNGNKLLSCGSGGMILTDDAAIADRVRRISAQARQGSRYQHDEPAFNYRMSNIHAAIGIAQLERLDEMIQARRNVAAQYRRVLEGSNRLRFMPEADWAEPNGWLSVVQVTDGGSVPAFLEALQNAGIQSGYFWESLSASGAYAGHGSTVTGVSQSLSGTTVTLPSSSSLSTAELDRVCAVLEQWR